MRKTLSYLLAMVLVLASSSACCAQDDLPRVLIIGDSIAGMYSRETSSVFKDKAKVEVGYKAGVSA